LAACPTSAPPPLLYTPLLAPDFLTLYLQPKLKLSVYLRPPPAIRQAPPTNSLPLALSQAELYTLYIIVIPTMGCVLDVLTQLQLHCAPCHRLKPAHLPHFSPHCHLPLPLPLPLPPQRPLPPREPPNPQYPAVLSTVPSVRHH
jgi:hypothetical protein